MFLKFQSQITFDSRFLKAFKMREPPDLGCQNFQRAHRYHQRWGGLRQVLWFLRTLVAGQTQFFDHFEDHWFMYTHPLPTGFLLKKREPPNTS
jgi:hypothetical protein